MPELTLFIDSKLGTNRSVDGSSFTYPLDPALMVPFDASPTMRVLEANVFYTSPNISAAKQNNRFRFSVITSGTVAGGNLITEDHTITFADGLYSLSDLNAELSDYLESKTSISDSAMSFVGHGPTQKVIIDWDTESATYGVVLRMSDADSIAPLLGYASIDLTYETGSGGKHHYFIGQSPADFDAVSLSIS